MSPAACDRRVDTDYHRTREEKTNEAAHQAGEDLYKAAAKTKELARRAAEELKKAGREARDGWEDAKHSDPHADAQYTNKSR